MSGIEVTFSAFAAQLNEVSRRARETLALFVERRGWLLISRIKTLESAIEKIETGRYRRLEDLDDLVAFSVIVDIRSDYREVISFLRKTFNVQVIRGKSTLNDERTFDFDATRVYAKLNMSEAGSPLNKFTFEIQIRTMLQHAWSKITHSLVYKSTNIDARKTRLAAEIMAHIEALDRSLSTFSTVARSVKYVRRDRSLQLNAIVTMVDALVVSGIVPAIVRPLNGRRYAESVLSAMDLRKMEFGKALTVVCDFYKLQAPIFPLSVSLYQLALIALHRKNILNSGSSKRPRYHYITSELISLFPESKNIIPTVMIY